MRQQEFDFAAHIAALAGFKTDINRILTPDDDHPINWAPNSSR